LIRSSFLSGSCSRPEEQNVELVGLGGLLSQLTKNVLDEMSRDLRPVYTAPSEAIARERVMEFDAKWGKQYPAISKLWENAWSEFIPFLDYDVEIRRVICSTNAIESINARYRRAVRARGHFPNDTAALKCLYLLTRALDPTGRGRARWAMR
jgi:putative transposase